MARFSGARKKYDSKLREVPAGIGGKKQHLKKYPKEIIFDSKSEAETYIHLQNLEKIGRIKNLRMQVKFELVPKIKWYNNIKQKNETQRAMNYIADFVFERENKTIIMDCKGWSKKKVKKVKKIGGKKTLTVDWEWACRVEDSYKIKKKILLNMIKDMPNTIFEEA
jgi:hypothetical protein